MCCPKVENCNTKENQVAELDLSEVKEVVKNVNCEQIGCELEFENVESNVPLKLGYSWQQVCAWTHDSLYLQIKFKNKTGHVVQSGTSPSEAPDPKNNQPHIFQDEDEDDATRQFFIVVKHLLIEVSNIVGAIFYLLAAHCVFNVAYHNKAKDVLLFLQSQSSLYIWKQKCHQHGTHIRHSAIHEA